MSEPTMTLMQSIRSFYQAPVTPQTPRPTLTGFFADETGQDLIEYALVAALVALGAILSLRGLSNKIDASFNAVGNSLSASY